MDENLNQIFTKIALICKDHCGFKISIENASNQSSEVRRLCLQGLDIMNAQFIKFKDQEQDYSKLQIHLQKQQTEIRKRIGVEQQLKLYTDALKTQVDELEAEKIELLENSKVYIKQLKKVNEGLFSKINKLQTDKSKSASKDKSKSAHKEKNQKNKPNKSLSQKKRDDKSLRQIIKTEYIDRQRSHSHKKPQMHTQGQQKIPYSSVTEHQTKRVISEKKQKIKEHPLSSKKKMKYLFSNYTLLDYMNSSKKKMKSKNNDYSPLRFSKKQIFFNKRIQMLGNGKFKSAKKQPKISSKKANKSVFSISSLENPSNKKER